MLAVVTNGCPISSARGTCREEWRRVKKSGNECRDKKNRYKKKEGNAETSPLFLGRLFKKKERRVMEVSQGGEVE